MKPEQLIPSLELCQRAQTLGWDKKTLFCWEDFSMLSNKSEDYFRLSFWNGNSIPAPTLQEVLEELEYAEINYNDGIWDVYTMAENEYTSKMHPNPVEAALELWCELEERKVKDE